MGRERDWVDRPEMEPLRRALQAKSLERATRVLEARGICPLAEWIAENVMGRGLFTRIDGDIYSSILLDSARMYGILTMDDDWMEADPTVSRNKQIFGWIHIRQLSGVLKNLSPVDLTAENFDADSEAREMGESLTCDSQDPMYWGMELCALRIAVASCLDRPVAALSEVQQRNVRSLTSDAFNMALVHVLAETSHKLILRETR